MTSIGVMLSINYDFSDVIILTKANKTISICADGRKLLVGYRKYST